MSALTGRNASSQSLKKGEFSGGGGPLSLPLLSLYIHTGE